MHPSPSPDPEPPAAADAPVADGPPPAPVPATARSRFASLKALYADPIRRRSRERDVGLRWQATDGTTYRAAWIEETGELYAVEHMRVDRRGTRRGGGVRILGRLPAAALDRALRGWSEICGQSASYEWLLGRMRRFPAASPA